MIETVVKWRPGEATREVAQCREVTKWRLEREVKTDPGRDAQAGRKPVNKK